MSYDTKAQKNRPAELPSGAALSTLVLEPEEPAQVEPAADTERELPDSED